MKNPCYRDLKETHSTNPVMFLLPCRLPLCNFWTSRFCVASALQLAIKNYDANLYMYRDVLGSFFSSIGFFISFYLIFFFFIFLPLYPFPCYTTRPIFFRSLPNVFSNFFFNKIFSLQQSYKFLSALLFHFLLRFVSGHHPRGWK